MTVSTPMRDVRISQCQNFFNSDESKKFFIPTTTAESL